MASRLCYAQDQGPRGKILDYDVPLTIGNVRVSPGDIIFGDWEGVLCIPSEFEPEIIKAALEKVAGKNLVRTALENGMSTVEAFETFGIMQRNFPDV